MTPSARCATPSSTTPCDTTDWPAFAQAMLDLCATPAHMAWGFREAPTATPASDPAPDGAAADQTPAALDDDPEDEANYDPFLGLADLFEDEDDAAFRALARRRDPRAGRVPRIGPLLAALRLARHFITADRMHGDLATPGAVTVLVTGDEALDDTVVRLLRIIFGPKGLGGRVPAPVIRPLNDLVGRAREGRPLRLSDLDATLRDEIELGRWMVFVAPVEPAWPDLLATLSPATCPLPPVDQEILREMLHALYPPSADHQDTDTLPEDRALARLDLEDLIALLRAPDAAAARQRLAAHLAPAPAEARGPGLAGFPMPREVRVAVDQLLADLRDWRAGLLPWRDVTRGLLFTGPPGCGKTEIPRLLGRDAGIPVIPASLARLQSIGARSSDVLREMRRVFAKAAADAPAIVFLDELDAFGDRNRPHDHNSAWTDSVVAALLECLDGFETTEGVIPIAATNHPEKIDAALRRPGRFDRRLSLGPPAPDQLGQAFRWHLGSDLADVDLTPLVTDAIGLSGAEIARIIRAGRARARAGGRPLDAEDLRAALAAAHPPLAPALRHRVAIHEAGHAFVAHLTGRGRPRMLAIHAQGGWAESAAAGQVVGRADIETELTVLLAGRAAERLVLGTVGGGAGGLEDSDLARATALATALELSWGLGASIVWRAGPSDAIAHLADDPALRRRVEAHLDRAEARALRRLDPVQTALVALAETLAARGLLTGSDLDKLLDAAHRKPRGGAPDHAGPLR